MDSADRQLRQVSLKDHVSVVAGSCWQEPGRDGLDSLMALLDQLFPAAPLPAAAGLALECVTGSPARLAAALSLRFEGNAGLVAGGLPAGGKWVGWEGRQEWGAYSYDGMFFAAFRLVSVSSGNAESSCAGRAKDGGQEA